jgi:hypothetical protein
MFPRKKTDPHHDIILNLRDENYYLILITRNANKINHGELVKMINYITAKTAFLFTCDYRAKKKKEMKIKVSEFSQNYSHALLNFLTVAHQISHIEIVIKN